MSDTPQPAPDIEPPARLRLRIVGLLPFLVVMAFLGLVGLYGMLPLPPPISETRTFEDTVTSVDCRTRGCKVRTQSHAALGFPGLPPQSLHLARLQPGDRITVEAYSDALGERVVSLRSGSEVFYARSNSLSLLWLQCGVGALFVGLPLYAATRVKWWGKHVHREPPLSPEARAVDRSGRRGGLAFVALAALLFIAAVSLQPHNQPSGSGSKDLQFAVSAMAAVGSCTLFALGVPNVVYGSPVPRTTWFKKALVSVPAGVCCFLAWTAFLVLRASFP